MRITGGAFRNRRVETQGAPRLRPSSDKTRARLFSMLRTRLAVFPPARVLDVFAGSGALGLEALSRGAAQCTFIEQAPAACRLVRSNLERLGAAERGIVLRRNALRLARPPSGLGPFDLALLDPPYGREDWRHALMQLAQFGWLAPQAWCVVETARTPAAPLPLQGFAHEAQRDDGRVRLVFYRRDG